MQIGPANPADSVVVIAELGNNHEGDPDVARRLVEAAADAGADAVKLQVYRVESFVRRQDAERYERMARFQLDRTAVSGVAERARSLGLAVVATPLDLASVELVEPLVDAFKIASGDNDFEALLRAVARHGRPVILSTGMSDLSILERAAEVLRPCPLAVLQCTSAYPAAPGEVNLAAIPLLAERLSAVSGYSDHTLGLEACVAAVAAGARVIEKHFTLDKRFSGYRDHALSADPADLREIVRRIREVETLLGERAKEVQPGEQETLFAARRSIVAARPLFAGHTLQLGDLTWLRPRDGLAPGEEAHVLGRRLRRDLEAGEPITTEAVH